MRSQVEVHWAQDAPKNCVPTKISNMIVGAAMPHLCEDLATPLDWA